MHPAFMTPGAAPAIPIWFVTGTTWPALRVALEPGARAFVDAAGFEPKPGRHLLLPGQGGGLGGGRVGGGGAASDPRPGRPLRRPGKGEGLGGVLFGLEADDGEKNPFPPGRLADLLPAGAYRLAHAPHDARLAALAVALGSYRFARYRKGEAKETRLEIPAGVDGADLSRIAEGVSLARDLINTPANDLGPAELEEAARALASRHGGSVRALVGDDLVKQNFPLIHAVGRAAERAPRLIDLAWGDAAHPKVTLIGKGVTFDTGGLDIKPESAMRIMKKDMGGAACVLAAAHMIMDRGLKLRLRVLIPAVENAISDRK